MKRFQNAEKRKNIVPQTMKKRIKQQNIRLIGKKTVSINCQW